MPSAPDCSAFLKQHHRISVDEEKAHIYAEDGIPEYWLIRPETRELDLYREPTASGYTSRTTLRDGDTLHT